MEAQLIEEIENMLGLEVKNLPNDILLELTKSTSKSELLGILLKLLNKPWGEMTNYINTNPTLIEIANNFAIKAVNENSNHRLLAELLVCLLENNNILFHKKADYITYQKLAHCLSYLIGNKNIQIDPVLKAKIYSNSVYADYIFKDEESKKL